MLSIHSWTKWTQLPSLDSSTIFETSHSKRQFQQITAILYKVVLFGSRQFAKQYDYVPNVSLSCIHSFVKLISQKYTSCIYVTTTYKNKDENYPIICKIGKYLNGKLVHNEYISYHAPHNELKLNEVTGSNKHLCTKVHQWITKVIIQPS